MIQCEKTFCLCFSETNDFLWCVPGVIFTEAFSICCVILRSVKMVGMKPKDIVPSASVKFFGAGTAACIADLVTFPLDTAKVRLQVRGAIIIYEPSHILTDSDPDMSY